MARTDAPSAFAAERSAVEAAAKHVLACRAELDRLQRDDQRAALAVAMMEEKQGEVEALLQEEEAAIGAAYLEGREGIPASLAQRLAEARGEAQRSRQAGAAAQAALGVLAPRLAAGKIALAASEVAFRNAAAAEGWARAKAGAQAYDAAIAAIGEALATEFTALRFVQDITHGDHDRSLRLRIRILSERLVTRDLEQPRFLHHPLGIEESKALYGEVQALLKEAPAKVA